MKDDIVIDIETMGTEDDCVIVSIGALIFNQEDEPGTYKHSFNVLVDVENQPGRSVDPATMLWWMKKSMDEARKKAFKSLGRKRLGLALKELDDFYKLHTPNLTWGCAPDFDMAILSHAFEAHNQKFPCKFYKWRDVRTLEDFIYGKNTRKEGGDNHFGGTAHDAFDDCIMEVSVIQNCRRLIT